VEVVAGFFTGGSMNQLPGGIAEPEEGPAVFSFEKMASGMNLDPRKRWRCGGIYRSCGAKAGQRLSGH